MPVTTVLIAPTGFAIFKKNLATWLNSLLSESDKLQLQQGHIIFFANVRLRFNLGFYLAGV